MTEPTAYLDPRAALLAERERALAELADAEVLAPGQITYGSQAASMAIRPAGARSSTPSMSNTTFVRMPRPIG